MRKLLMLAATVAPMLLALPALASDPKCTDAPRDQWMSETELRTRLQGMGYEVREIDREGHCYEVEGRDANGFEVEAHIDPVSGAVVQDDH
ncbi:MAG: PepSY domain-containing protein [Geminicoccaceae bacterium]